MNYVVKELIQNKILAVVLAFITFILGSVLVVSIIFYILGYPLSSISEHQLYAVFGVLVGVVLASMVYGRGSKERASGVAKCLNESLGLEIKEEDIRESMSFLERFPPFVINEYVSKNINAVEEFEEQIKDYKNKLSDEDQLIIRRVVDTPVPDLQNLLDKLYSETNMEQFKVLADAKAEPFLTLNLHELKRVLFNE